MTGGVSFRRDAGQFREPRMASTEGIRARINALARELAAELGEVDESLGDCWLDAVENQAVELGDAITAAVVRQLALRRPVEGEAACPQCGEAGRYEGVRQRELIGRRGPLEVEEPEYFCPCCRKAFFPSDGGDRGRRRLPVHGRDAQEGGPRGGAVPVVRRGERRP